MILEKVHPPKQFGRWLMRQRWLTGGGVAAFTVFTGVYWQLFELFGQKWSFYSDFPLAHQIISLVLTALLILFAIFNWAKGKAEASVPDNSRWVYDEFFAMTGRIVQTKLDRISDAMPTLTKADLYSKVCDPSAQIKVIYTQAMAFFTHVFNIQESEIDFTVLEKLPKKDWDWAKDLCQKRTWTRLAPGQLARGNSLAKYVISKGGDIFRASKTVALAEGIYLADPRDDPKLQEGVGDGSVFSIYLTFSLPSGDFKYVFSIATFGRRLCDPDQADAIKVAESFCREIARRVELELESRVIKCL